MVYKIEMDTPEQIEVVRKLVEDSFSENSHYTGLSSLDEQSKDHIINIGTSILCTKWEVGYKGGGFVQSVVSNDLMGAVGNADGTSLKGLKFFLQLMYNNSKPITLQHNK